MDLERVTNEFLKYTKNYDLNNENIKGKQLHSLRVMEVSEKIAIGLKLKKDEIELAKLIGLLHDIARFEQYTQYGLYNDLLSFDHAEYGVKILKENNFLRKFIKETKYDEIILKAIKNHNKFEIEQGLSEQELLFAKIIRDADKIDILYEGTEFFWKNQVKEIENSTISEEVLDVINKHQLVKRKKSLKYDTLDSVISVVAFIFDINFDVSIKMIQENNYINNILDRFKYKKLKAIEQVDEVKKIIGNYTKNF